MRSSPGAYPITNENLKLSDIPPVDSEMSIIFEFAQSFDGYGLLGDELCGEIANERRQTTLSDVRACLFFEHRRYRHMGDMPDPGDEIYIRNLIRKILDWKRTRADDLPLCPSPPNGNYRPCRNP